MPRSRILSLGISSLLACSSASTLAALPAPTSLTATPVSSTKYQITWVPAVGSTSTQLTLTNGSRVYRLRTTGNTLAPSFPDNGTWIIEIQGRNGNETGPTVTTSISVSIPAPTAIPTNVVVIPFNGRLDLRWDAGTFPDVMQISWQDPVTLSSQQITVKGTYVSLKGLQNHVPYVLSLQWKNSAGNGPSVTVTGTPTDDRISTPITPDTIAVSPTSSGLSWPPVPGATYYLTYYGNSSSYATLKATTLPRITTVPYVTLTGVQPNWYAFVVAGNANGTGPVNPTPTPLPLVVAPQSAPTLTLSPGLQSATASWTVVPGAVSYTLGYMPTPFAWPTATKIIDATSPTVLSGLPEWVEVGAAVLGANSAGNGPLSDTQFATPYAPPTDQPLVTITAQSTSLTVSWTAVPHADSYVIYRSSGPFSLASAVAIPASTSPATITGLTPGTQYQIAVAATNIAGTGPLSVVHSVNTTGTFTGSGATAGPSLTAAGLEQGVALPDGRVFLVGGYLPDNSLSKIAQIYNPATNTMTTVASMSTARLGHTATLLSDGRILVAGGSDGGALDTAEIYNPVSNIWSSTGSMSAARMYHTATLLPDGRVIVIGGLSTTCGCAIGNVDIFNPTTGVWTPASSIPPRRQHFAALLQNGKVLVFGGLGNSSSTPLTSSIMYDPVANAWSAVGNMLVSRNYPAMTVLQDGRILVAGGYLGSTYYSSTEIFNPSTNLWSAGPAMTTPRMQSAMVTLLDGRVLIAGGMTSLPLSYNFTGFLRSTEIFAPNTNQWSVGPDLITPRAQAGGFTLQDGRVFIVSGSGPAGNLVSTELLN
jgi:hypothetical protein